MKTGKCFWIRTVVGVGRCGSAAGRRQMDESSGLKREGRVKNLNTWVFVPRSPSETLQGPLFGFLSLSHVLWLHLHACLILSDRQLSPGHVHQQRPNLCLAPSHPFSMVARTTYGKPYIRSHHSCVSKLSMSPITQGIKSKPLAAF